MNTDNSTELQIIRVLYQQSKNVTSMNSQVDHALFQQKTCPYMQTIRLG